jgi:hypothetical protein
MKKNMLENLPSELLDKLIECVNNKIPLSMSSKRLKEFFNKKDEVFFVKLAKIFIQKNKEAMSNTMNYFQYKKSQDSLKLLKKQLDDYECFLIEFFNDNEKDNVIQQLLSDKIFDNKRDVIKKLFDEHNVATIELQCIQIKNQKLLIKEQSQALINFNTKQREDFKIFDFDIEEPQYRAIDYQIFFCEQTDAIKNLQNIQDNNTKKLQSEHIKALLELQFKQNKALLSLPDMSCHQKIGINKLIDVIKNLQNIQNNNIRKLQFEHMKAIYELQFNQSINTHEHNFNHVKSTELLHITLVKAYILDMKKNVKTIIHRMSQLHCSILTIISEEPVNDEYNKYIIDIKILKIIIFLYLTKEFNSELDFSLIKNDWGHIWLIEDRNLDYLKIVFPTLNNITKLEIFNGDDDNNKLFELLLMLPKLQTLKLTITSTYINFKLPEKKLQINDLEIELQEYSDCENYNIHKILDLCPYINKLKISDESLCTPAELDNKYLVELGKKLKKCNKLFFLEISNFRLPDNTEEQEEQLDFTSVLSECPNLTNLNLSNNAIQNKEAINIAKILSKSTTSNTGSRVSFKDCTTSITGSRVSFKDCTTSITDCTTLTNLDLSGNNISSGIEIAKILSHNQRLKLLL